MKTCYIYLENGIFLEAKSFGADGSSVGEIVFNTSLSGYQEIITDPSYAGQFITFTMPEIGIVGVNSNDCESSKVFAKGVIVRSYNENYSNFRAEESLGAFLKKHNIIGITNIDTRFLTKTLREEGAMMMIASTEISDKDELANMLKNSPRIEHINYIKEVSTKNSYTHQKSVWDFSEMGYKTPTNERKKIIAFDFGIKQNILNELTNVNLDIEVVPENTNAEYIINKFDKGEIHGVFLSNGPGDPLVLSDIVCEVKKLIVKKIPIGAICLGHQILSIAHGYNTYKLKFGHHGGNHPIKNLANGSVEISAQNHNYSVPEEIKEIAEVTHINLFDGTYEGLRYKESPIVSVQHHPEASPGPNEGKYIFKEFAKLMN